jgi:hypothetical protein
LLIANCRFKHNASRGLTETVRAVNQQSNNHQSITANQSAIRNEQFAIVDG